MTNTTNCFPPIQQTELCTQFSTLSLEPYQQNQFHAALSTKKKNEKITAIATKASTAFEEYQSNPSEKTATRTIAVLTSCRKELQKFRKKEENKDSLERYELCLKQYRTVIEALQDMQKEDSFSPFLYEEKEKTFLENFFEYFRLPVAFGAPTTTLYVDQQAYFTNIIANDPKNARAYLSRSKALFTQERFQEALRDALISTQLASDNPLGFMMVGECYFELREIHKAYEAFTQSLALGHTTGEMHYRTGVLATELGKYEEAKSLLVKAAEKTPDKYSNHELYNYYLGKAELFLKNFKSAIQIFEKALKINPNMYKPLRFDCYFLSAQSFIHLNDFISAKEAIDRAHPYLVEDHKNNPMYYTLRGIIYFAQDHDSFEKVQEDFKEVRLAGSIDPEDSVIQWYYKVANRMDLVKSYFERLTAISTRPQDHFYLSQVYLIDGDIPKSMKAFHKALSHQSQGVCSDVEADSLRLFDLAEKMATNSTTETQKVFEKEAVAIYSRASSQRGLTPIENLAAGMFYFFSTTPQHATYFFQQAAEQDSKFAVVSRLLALLIEGDRDQILKEVRFVFGSVDFLSRSFFDFEASRESSILFFMSLASVVRLGAAQNSSQLIKTAFHLFRAYEECSQSNQALLNKPQPSWLMQGAMFAAGVVSVYILFVESLVKKNTVVPKPKPQEKKSQSAPETKKTTYKKTEVPKSESDLYLEKVEAYLKNVIDSASWFEVRSVQNDYKAFIDCTSSKYWSVLKRDDSREKYMVILSKRLGAIESKTLDDPASDIRRWVLSFKKSPLLEEISVAATEEDRKAFQQQNEKL
jgi:tetratricopeptide (TPR) repeat protein